ncbi:hypothetical protein BH10BAC3_BH10BAC3_03790 [soil metagenome]
MNNDQQKRFKLYAATNKLELIQSAFKTGAGRSDADKESNYIEIHYILSKLGFKNTKAEVEQGADLLMEAIGKHVEVKEPPKDNGAAGKLATLKQESTDVQAVINKVDVRLDIGQLKHQHPEVPIGTRKVGGGNRFVFDCNAEWHRNNTIAHMAAWANGIAGLAEGQTIYHGQFVPVNTIHYEGYCLMSGGTKYVLFHCYPNDNSPLKLVNYKK